MRMVNECAERGLFLANTFLRHKIIHWYTWRRREDGEEEKRLIDYTAVMCQGRIERVMRTHMGGLV